MAVARVAGARRWRGWSDRSASILKRSKVGRATGVRDADIGAFVDEVAACGERKKRTIRERTTRLSRTAAQVTLRDAKSESLTVTDSVQELKL